MSLLTHMKSHVHPYEYMFTNISLYWVDSYSGALK